VTNTVLTATQVTREALRVLHQKLNFVGRVTRQYDDEYAIKGAKIGSTLKVRLPNEYTVRTGATMATQDTSETSLDVTMATQKGVDVNFTGVDLTLSLDDFSDRVLDPMMSVLAANIEADALSMYKDVYNQVNNIGSAATYAKLLGVRKLLVDNLTPMDKSATMVLNTQDNVDLVDAMKGLFQPSQIIAEQMKDGSLGRSAGFEFFENTLLVKHTSGTDANNCTVNGATQTGASITIANGSSKTFVKGDIVTFAGCNRCHPESKADTGALQTFVVTADVAAGGTTMTVSPAITTSGARQNCVASPTNGGTVTKHGGASAVYGISLGFHKDAFVFVSADLVMPKGVHFGAREVMDGISMRIVSQYDITNDKFPCRIDVLYGFKTVRAQLACRFANN
jgi:hypothetical protein